MRFTKPSIAALSLPRDRPEVFHWDDAMPGFGIRLRASGARRFIVQYGESGGRTRRVVLGDPGVVGLDDARRAAKALLAKVRLGADPQSDKVTARNAITFAILGERYLGAVGNSMRPGTRDAVRRHLQTHARPLHHKSASKIERSDIAALLSDVARERGPIAANRLRATLSALFTWAVMEGRLSANPVSGTMVRPEISRDRILTDDELAAIWNGTDTGSDHDRIVRLLMLTACRRHEIGRMHWSELDGDLFTLPASRSKNRLPHEVPLHALAVAQLPPRSGGRDVVFGRLEAGYSGWSRSKARLDGRLHLAPWGLHDLRRSCATWLSEHGTEPQHVDAVLGHISGTAKRGVAGVYNRATYREQKRQALSRWADHIAQITGQTTTNISALTGVG